MATTGGVSNNDYYIGNTSLGSSSIITGKGADQMNMDDFFNLLVAQMTNQDMLNPQADTDYIAQMAQFTTLQGINTIQEYQLASYASSYAGKTVAIAYTAENGNITKTEGVVSGVTFYDGDPKVIVNGVSYPLYSVMEVKDGTTSGSTGGTGETGGTDETEGGSKTDNITMEQAAAYIDRYVTIQYLDDDVTVKVEGRVTGLAKDKDGRVMVIVNDEEFYASDIVSVNGTPIDEYEEI